jgi:hypothetical protein
MVVQDSSLVHVTGVLPVRRRKVTAVVQEGTRDGRYNRSLDLYVSISYSRPQRIQAARAKGPYAPRCTMDGRSVA